MNEATRRLFHDLLSVTSRRGSSYVSLADLRAVEAAEDRLLCAAVRTCTKASGTLAVLWQRAMYTPEILPRLMNDACGTSGPASAASRRMEWVARPPSP
ncbi:hypothetical protein ACIHCQ_35540 [Streptomyces sp. NPDC052236]|uniref:hypothetical protein n=1 Tax=Streptomyces sp. NPDC052236 TaxID=3365686 RepID=UPI0037D0FB38